MRHGYTNNTELVGGVVRKAYAGPDAVSRRDSERRALTALSDFCPVPAIVASDAQSITTTFVRGQHGQDLIDAGHGAQVLRECGRLLRELHALDPALFGRDRREGVIQHGDFGPNNVLFAGDPPRAAAVLDWEFSDVGPAITDIAWCEWIVRMHHPHAVTHLPAFFAAYGDRPPWPQRQREMLRRCAWLEDLCRRWDTDHPGIGQWQERAARTGEWSALGDDA